MSLGLGDYSSSPPQSSAAARRRKKKMDGRLTTSFSLPRLDEMVLLKPMSTCEIRDPSKTEKTRTTSINDQLDRYNRWLPFIHSSSPGSKVRSAAMELQHTIHEMNTAMAEMMIQIDRKIVDLQDRTDVFVEAVKEGDLWQTNGDLLDLSYAELDNALIKHPQRNTEALLRHICDLVRKEVGASDTWGVGVRPRAGRVAEKLLRLIQEVRSCPNGAYEAFHLYVFVKAHIFPDWDTDTFGLIGTETDNKKAESRMLEIIKESHLDPYGRINKEPPTFFNFAAARRKLWNSMPTDCTACERRQSPLDPSDPMYVPPLPPFPPCRRSSNLNIIERLQEEAYGEIKAGIMLTLPSKLPRELCLLIFEFTMAVEGIPLDPHVWEPWESSDGDHVVHWPVKEMYRCRSTSAH